MKQYNIYAGEKGKCAYMYTSLFENLDEAKHIAEEEMHAQFAVTPKRKIWEDAIMEASQYDTDTNLSGAFAIYSSYVDNWGEYNAVLTSEDSIPLNDLILDYVESSDEGKTSGTRN